MHGRTDVNDAYIAARRSHAAHGANPSIQTQSRSTGKDHGTDKGCIFKPVSPVVHAFAWIVVRIVWRMRMLEYAIGWFERESATTVVVPRWKRPLLWWRGFLSESDVLYDLRADSRDDYLTDFERFIGTRTINGPYSILLDDKLVFDRLLEGVTRFKPRTFGILDGERVVGNPRIDSPNEMVPLCELLVREGRLAVKPATGGGGKGFAVFALDTSGRFFINGSAVPRERIESYGRYSDRLMVCEHVTQHRVLGEFYPHTTNSVRLLTMRDEDEEPFLARAVVRMGRRSSESTDNWIMGGLCAEVDVSSGVLGPAAPFPSGADRIEWLTHHPDSGAVIQGAILPNWPMIRTEIVRIARAFEEIHSVGWDIVITDDGFRIIEANSYSGVNLFQVHRPLLTDARTRSFFQRYGILTR